MSFIQISNGEHINTEVIESYKLSTRDRVEEKWEGDSIKRKIGEEHHMETILEAKLTTGRSRTFYGADADALHAVLKHL